MGQLVKGKGKMMDLKLIVFDLDGVIGRYGVSGFSTAKWLS